MIKITNATYCREQTIKLEFSDGTWGEYNFSKLFIPETALTGPLRSETEFARFFLELGALCWPNGLEIGASSLQTRLRNAKALNSSQVA